jgi:hypothetical protein
MSKSQKPGPNRSDSGLKEDIEDPAKKKSNGRNFEKSKDQRPKTDEEKQRIAEEERKARRSRGKGSETHEAEKDIQHKGQPIAGEDQEVMPK